MTTKASAIRVPGAVHHEVAPQTRDPDCFLPADRDPASAVHR
jgi:hypothetical protein